MRPAALSIAVLLGIASLGGASQAHATPTVSATITIESGHTVKIGGKRHHRDFHRGPSHRHKNLARHHKRWHDGRHHKRWQHGRHHKRWHDGRHHRPAFAKGSRKAPVVIIKPAHGWKFGHRQVRVRPLVKHGRFVRGPFRW